VEQVQRFNVGQVAFNRYRILEFLGEGGLAYNYLAKMLEPPFVKVVLKQTKRRQELNGKISEDRFQMEREFRLLSELKHPGIPRVFEMFEEDNIVCFAREYRRGELLEDMIKRGISRHRVESVAWQLLDILEYLHEWEIVYRDLKPSNILVDRRGRVFLFDFGTSRFHKPGKETDTIALGTPGFASPEQYGKRQTDIRADIYSFGALLYYMLTGDDPEKRPFEIGEEKNLIEMIPDPDLRFILKKCLNLDPDNRYHFISRLRKDILQRHVFTNMPSIYTYADTVKYRRHGSLATASTLLFLIALLMLISPLFSSFHHRIEHRCGKSRRGVVRHKRYREYYEKLIKIGDAYAKVGQWEEALDPYRKAAYYHFSKPESRLKLAMALYHNGDCEDALTELNRYITHKPGDYRAYEARAVILDKMGNYNRALTNMNRSIELTKTSGGFHYRGIIYYHNGELKKAIEDLESSLKLDSGRHWIYTDLGLVNILDGNYESARNHLNSSIKIKPSSNFAYVIRGWLNIFEGRNNDAKKDLRLSLIQRDHESDAFAALAFLSLVECKQEESDRYLELGYSQNPDNPDLFYVAAINQLETGFNDWARDELLNAAASDPQLVDQMWYRQAAKYAKSKKARKLARKLVNLIDMSDRNL